MKKLKALVSISIIIITLLASGFPVAALNDASIPDTAITYNESRSVQNFFVEAKMLKGNGSGYGLEQTASRLEGIVILIRSMGKESEAQKMKSLPCHFADVPGWAAGYVNYAFANNISKGVSENRFGVNDKMTADQYNSLMLRFLGYDDSKGDFQWDQSVEKAGELSILTSRMIAYYQSAEAYTKGDLIDTTFYYLESNFKDKDKTLIEFLIEENVISKELAEKYGLSVEGWESILTSFNEENHMSFRANEQEDELILSGTCKNPEISWLLVYISDARNEAKRGEEVGEIGEDGKFEIKCDLGLVPDGTYFIDVYGNDEKYNYYSSIILSSIIMVKTEDGSIFFKAPPVYGLNLRIHNGNKLDVTDYGLAGGTSDSDFKTIKALAGEITNGISADYDKAQAIHDWVADNIYYDVAFLENKTDETNINSIDVLNRKYAVCSGYSNLMKDLLTAAEIPNRQIIGYALGISEEEHWDELDIKKLEPNHIWNEAYVDGRWIIIDATWDSPNRYKSGKFVDGGSVSQLYFDVTVPFLSSRHMVMEP